MKVIIQSDDFGITEAVSCGIIKAIKDGVLSCTGLFSNMPAAEFAVEAIRPYSHICLGEDINLVAGRPCADPSDIPTLVQENGYFKTSGMHRAIDQADGCQKHLSLDECLIEVEAQIQRFIELTGKKPEYLHGHSYQAPEIRQAMKAMSEKYQVPLTSEMIAQNQMAKLSKTWNKKPFSFEDQRAADPLSCVLEDREFLKHDLGWIGFHCGYVDNELFDVSTYTVIRNRDLAAVTSHEMKQWIEDNQIEVITYRDLNRGESKC